MRAEMEVGMKKPRHKKERTLTRPKSQAKKIRESSQIVSLEGVIDEANRVVNNVSVLGNVSRNGYGYAESAMTKAVEVFEGAKVFIDHREEDEKGNITPHSALDYLGRMSELYLDGDRVKAKKFHVVNSKHWQFVKDVVEHDPDGIGFSIDGMVQIGEDGSTVVDFIEGYSVDLVSDPATNRGVFESRKRKKENVVDLSQLTIDDLKSQRPDLVAEILKAGLEEMLSKVDDGGGETPPPDSGDQPPPDAGSESEQEGETPPETPPVGGAPKTESLVKKLAKRKLALNESELEIAEALSGTKLDKYLDSLVISKRESERRPPNRQRESGKDKKVDANSLFA